MRPAVPFLHKGKLLPRNVPDFFSWDIYLSSFVYPFIQYFIICIEYVSVFLNFKLFDPPYFLLPHPFFLNFFLSSSPFQTLSISLLSGTLEIFQAHFTFLCLAKNQSFLHGVLAFFIELLFKNQDLGAEYVIWD